MNKDKPGEASDDFSAPNPVSYIEQGYRHHQAGNLSEAESAYRQVLRIEPDNPDANHLLGLIAHQMGHSEAAEKLIEKAIDTNPNNEAYHCNLGNIFLETEKLEEAIAAYNRALAIEPDNASAHCNLGSVFKKQGRLFDAADCFRQAVTIQPDFAIAHFNLGLALHELGRLDDAVTSYNRAVEILPDYKEAYNNCGNSLNDLGRTDEALTSFGKALAIDPDYAEAHFNKHGLLINPNDLSPSIECLEKAVENNPSANNKLYLGICLDCAGSQERAEDYFSQAKEGSSLTNARLDAWRYLKSTGTDLPLIFGSPIDAFKLAFQNAREDGLILEFGVRFGASIRQIAKLTDEPIHGFDSFEGLQSEWHERPKGSYSTGGEIPDVPEHVTLIQGWFDQTLPEFAITHRGPVRFINVDCDTYESTKTIFDILAPQIVEGTVIVFDEYIGNRHWREDEFKAFQEAVTDNGWAYDYLGFSMVTKQVVTLIR